MLLKFFKQPLPSVLSAILVLAILGWLKSFLSTEVHPFSFEQYNMPLYLLVNSIVGDSLLTHRIVAFIVLIICSLYLIQLNAKHIIIKHRTYLPALFFIILSSGFIPLQRLNPAIFATFFLISVIDNIYSAYDSKNFLDRYFKAGFFVSVASLFYFPAVFFLVLVFVSKVILKPSGFKGWIVIIGGFIIPWLFLLFYYYFFYDNPVVFVEIMSNALDAIIAEKSFGIPFIIFYAFSGLILIISLFFLFGILATQKVSVRKFFTILIWFWLISISIALLSQSTYLEIIYIAAIPTSYLFSNYFTFARNRFWPELFFNGIIVLAILMQFF